MSNKQQIALLEKELSENLKETNNTTTEDEAGEIFSRQIKALANKIADQPAFSAFNFSKSTNIGYQTFLKWRRKGVNSAHEGNLEYLRNYLRMERIHLDRFLAGKITLDELWEQRNTDMGIGTVTYEQMLLDITHLSFDEVVSLAKAVPEILADRYAAMAEELVTPEEVEPEIEYVELSDRARTRLRALLNISLQYTQKTVVDLLKEGVDGSLLEDIQSGDQLLYTEEAYQTLAPFLRAPIQWVSDTLPVVDPNARFGEDLEELFNELDGDS